MDKGGRKMKKLLLGTIFLALLLIFPIPTMAAIDVSISISPPPIVFAAPPELIVLPDTYVYVAPDVDADLFFWNGWWWKPRQQHQQKVQQPRHSQPQGKPERRGKEKQDRK